MEGGARRSDRLPGETGDPVTSPDPLATLKALADPTRVEIMDRVAQGSQVTTTQLAAVLPITRQAIARHVRTLESAGLLVRTRHGREQRYRADVGPLRNAERWLARREASWEQALSRLAAYLEQSGD